MPTYGLTPTGWVSKPREQIVADILARLRATVDPSITLAENGVLARVTDTYVDEIMLLWNEAAKLFDAHAPGSARGIAVDHNAALAGLLRLSKTKTRFMLLLTLSEHTTVEKGSVVAAPSSADQFETLQDASTTDSPAIVTAFAEAVKFGRVVVEPNTPMRIVSPVAGWTAAVTGPDQPTLGHDVEGDADYERRRAETVASIGGSTSAGAIADVRKLDHVLHATAIENDSDLAVGGLPPHSFEVIVQTDADSDAAIAAAILKNKPAGIQTVGEVMLMTPDADGVERAVRFTHATPVRININYEGDFDDLYIPGTLKAFIEAEVADPKSRAHFGVGRNVYVPRLISVGFMVLGVRNLKLDIARHPDVPADATPSPVDKGVVIGAREVAYFDHDSWVGNG